MYALRININGEVPVVAGSEDLGVLNAIVNCVGKLGDGGRKLDDQEDADLFLHVGGLTSRHDKATDEHVRWITNRPLCVGDVVIIEIIKSDSADSPTEAHAPKKRQDDEREYFEHCKREYPQLREKYEVWNRPREVTREKLLLNRKAIENNECGRTPASQALTSSLRPICNVATQWS